MMRCASESIYNIIPPKEFALERAPRYKSSYPGNLPPTATTFHSRGSSHPIASNVAGTAQAKVVGDKACRSMGKPNGFSTNDPAIFMKKMARSSSVPTLRQTRKVNPDSLMPTTLKTKLKPTIPKTSDAPVMNLVTAKNFVVANAVETILAAPKQIPQGTKDYLHKEDYGKVPRYLKNINQDIANEFQYIEAMEQQQRDDYASAQKPLDQEERLHMIECLKQKWESINQEYQGSTHMMRLDTHGKVYRKEKWEAMLTSIEKDIERLNKSNIIIDSTC